MYGHLFKCSHLASLKQKVRRIAGNEQKGRDGTIKLRSDDRKDCVASDRSPAGWRVSTRILARTEDVSSTKDHLIMIS